MKIITVFSFAFPLEKAVDQFLYLSVNIEKLMSPAQQLLEQILNLMKFAYTWCILMFLISKENWRV